MTTTHQLGYVTLGGTKTKVWIGHYKRKDAAGIWRAATKVVGAKDGMTKGQAKEALAEFIRGGPTVEAARVATDSFTSAALKYLTLKQADWGKATRDNMHCIFHKTVIPALGHLRICDILPTDCKALFNSANSSQSQLHKVVTHTRAVFEMLLDDGVIGRNPARSKTAKPPEPAVKPSGFYLPLPDAKALLAAAEGQDFLILRIMLSCALRPSEVLALRVNDIEPGRLKIDEAATSMEGLKSTKTDESFGYVPVSPTLENLIRIHAAGLDDSTAMAWLFPSDANTPIKVNNFLRRNVRAVAERAGLGRVTLQCLRRTVATHMQHHGAVKSAQGLLRHADASTTLRHYQKTISADVVTAAGSWDDELN